MFSQADCCVVNTGGHTPHCQHCVTVGLTVLQATAAGAYPLHTGSETPGLEGL